MAFCDHFQQEQQFFWVSGSLSEIGWEDWTGFIIVMLLLTILKVSIGFGVYWSLLAQA